MSRCYAYIVAYISRLEIGNVVLRPARLEVGHYDSCNATMTAVWYLVHFVKYQLTKMMAGCIVNVGHAK